MFSARTTMVPAFVLTLAFFLVNGFYVQAQLKRQVLFLGNSYTSVNDLPGLITEMARSTGDTLVFDSYTPGAYQLIDHSIDPVSRQKIMAGNWNYVVIQGQSQESIVAYTQFTSGANALYSLIKQYNPCSVTMPFITWGRKNGDASTCPNFPLTCTYQGMDTTIRNRYLSFTSFINGEVSPVSVVWNYLRKNHPGIELYQPDGSHPSVAGSYAAASCFYASIFKKDPTLVNFPFGLNTVDADIIKNAVKTLVFDQPEKWDFKKPPASNFLYEVGPGINELRFSPIQHGVRQQYYWDFGDGTYSSVPNPSHSYLSNGSYTVSLTTTTCDVQGLHSSNTKKTIQFCSHTPAIYTSKPWLCRFDTLWTQAADSYQWFINGIPIPETRQYLPDYYRYGITGFTVLGTQNGCAELSRPFMKTHEWSGYYFDLVGDPCAGDTVAFAVLHTSGSLPGLEKIFWYRNNQLLTSATNEDTLWISAGGRYECKVVASNSRCPLDTTSYVIEYPCGPPDHPAPDPVQVWRVYPNPTTGDISFQFVNTIQHDQLLLYNSTGMLVRMWEISGRATLRVSIADLPGGLYFARLKMAEQPVLKLIKK